MNNISCSGADCSVIHRQRMEEARSALKNIKAISKLTAFFKSFADDTRLRIMIVLDSVEEMCVNDIAVALDMTKSAISHQLSYLKDCGLLKSRKEGKVVFYSLMDNHVKLALEMGVEHVGHKEEI